MKALLLCACAAAGVYGCLDGDLKQRRTTVPEALDDGWEIATPQSVGLDPSALATLHDEILREDRYVAMRGLLVVSRGKLVWETYLRSGADRDRPDNVQSITKSVIALAAGISLARGELPGLDATVAELFPEEASDLDETRRAIRLRDLLTMRSGLDLHNDVFSLRMWVDGQSDPVHYMLTRPMYAAPGERFFYRDLDPQLVSHALTRATGRSALELVQERVFTPLGIDAVSWPAGPDGVTHGAHHLRLRMRDLAKLGQLCLQRGTWSGAELVPAAWIDEATSPQVAAEEIGGQGEDAVGYGYYFWVVPGVGYTMVGKGGQFVFVVPDESLVIVSIGYPDSELHGWTVEQFLPLVRLLLDATEASGP